MKRFPVILSIAVLAWITPVQAPGLVTTDAHPRSRVVSPDFDHVVILVLENKGYDQVIGNPDAPYLNGLADGAGLSTRFYGIRHPSLPNCLALLGGSAFGITSDCTSCRTCGRSLADQFEATASPAKGYRGGTPFLYPQDQRGRLGSSAAARRRLRVHGAHDGILLIEARVAPSIYQLLLDTGVALASR